MRHVHFPTALKRIAPPRSPEASVFLSRYEPKVRPYIFASAILPLIITSEDSALWGGLVGVASWLVFLADFIVQSKERVQYYNSRLGLLDLFIVVVTSPWYLIPGVHGGAVVALLRVVRVVRLIVVARGARRLFQRLGRAALIAVAAVVAFSAVALRAEQPVNPEFASYGDALWWGYVTLTTVGYGDIVPVTLTGRLAGVAIMTLGIGLLGVLAGSLSSFFRLSPKEEEQEQEKSDEMRKELGLVNPHDEPDSDGEGPQDTGDLAALRKEVVDLRSEIRSLTDHLARSVGAVEPTPSEEPPESSV